MLIIPFGGEHSYLAKYRNIAQLMKKQQHPPTISAQNFQMLYLYFTKTDLMDSNQQNFWNFSSLFFYLGLIVLAGFMMQANGTEIRDVTTKDLIIVILATYRLTRLVVFEKIFKFVRDLIKNNNRYALFNTLQFIVTCPWCTGVWMALVVFVFFYLIPYGDLLVYALAIAGIASFLVQAANLVGLHLEEKQGDRHGK